jgi:bacterioferritin-associated ferredoxin
VTNAFDQSQPGPAAMIVCSCNVLSDQDVRSTLSGDDAARTCGEVYGCLGCSAQCGRCARTIRRIMNEALAGADAGCCRANGKS